MSASTIPQVHISHEHKAETLADADFARIEEVFISGIISQNMPRNACHSEILWRKRRGRKTPAPELMALFQSVISGKPPHPQFPVILPAGLYEEAQKAGIDLTGFVKSRPIPRVVPTRMEALMTTMRQSLQGRW